MVAQGDAPFEQRTDRQYSAFLNNLYESNRGVALEDGIDFDYNHK
jgi:hypothetical protein